MDRPLTRTQWLILSQLGLVACAPKPEPLPPDPVPNVVIQPTPPPTATIAAPEPPPPPPEPPPPELKGECETSRDCGPRSRCVKRGNRPSYCVRKRYRGRPLVVDGTQREAQPDARPIDPAEVSIDLDPATRDSLASTLRRASFEEHASVAAFARTVCQLMALGAPLDLIERTQAALFDEIAHTRTCLAWAQRLDGDPTGPGALDAATAPMTSDPEALLVDVLRGGCIGETLAAHAVAQQASTAPVDALADDLAAIADDEARHAALAFDTVRWLIETRPALRETVDSERQRFERTASADDRATLAPLWAALG